MWDDGAEHRRRIDCDDLHFPPSFVWGTASAAHQVEGGCTNNNWSRWEQQRHADGRPTVKHGERAGQACDHWNRIDEDIGLMTALGTNAYRFSIEWSKLEPAQGQWDVEAERHYRTVLDKLRAAGIEPFITLYHFTHPIWFDDLGAFERTENLPIFAAFCARAFTAFGGQARFWCTINEPEVLASTSYFRGDFPPGKQDWHLAGTVLKNLCEAHVQAYYAIKGTPASILQTEAAERQRILANLTPPSAPPSPPPSRSALPGGDQAQVGIVKNIFQFRPWNDWNPLERWVAGMLDDAFNASVLGFFQKGVFHCRLGPVVVHHVNPKCVAVTCADTLCGTGPTDAAPH